MKCPTCGNEMNDLSSFCVECGTLNPKIFPPEKENDTKTEAQTNTTLNKDPSTAGALLQAPKWKLIGIVVGLIFIISAIVFFSGSKPMETPDEMINLLVMNCDDFKPDKYAMSVTSAHRYDEESKIDTVNITITAEGTYGYYMTSCVARYQYDRSSDAWTLLSADEWSKKEYRLSDNIIGREWIVGSTSGGDKSQYTVKITSISDNLATVDIKIQEMAYAGILTGDIPFELSCTKTGEIVTATIKLQVELPEGFACQTSAGKTSKNATVWIFFDIHKGIRSVLTDYIFPVN